MDHIMDPSLTLLNSKIPPFRFRHQMGFRDQLGYVLGQHDMQLRGAETSSAEVAAHSQRRKET